MEQTTEKLNVFIYIHKYHFLHVYATGRKRADEIINTYNECKKVNYIFYIKSTRTINEKHDIHICNLLKKGKTLKEIEDYQIELAKRK